MSLYRITSFKGLLLVLSGFVLTLFAVFSLNKLGVAEMIFGIDFANNIIYHIGNIGIQALAFVVSVIVIPVLAVMAIVSYVRHHGETKEPSEELKAIRELTQAIKENGNGQCANYKPKSDKSTDELR